MYPLKGPPAEAESLGTLIARLGDDVRRIVRAEVGLGYVRAGAALAAVRGAGVLIVVGLACACGGTGALVAGLVLVVAQWLVPWAAALAVGVGLAIVATVLLAVQGRVVAGGVREAVSGVVLQVSGDERRGGD